MILMPMGAVIFVDFWLLERFGLRRNYAEATGATFNWAAGLAWFLTMAVCTALVQFAGVQIYFVSLPGWFVAAVLYVMLSMIWQQKRACLQ
jgi:purine-cytosine permease-like protein